MGFTKLPAPDTNKSTMSGIKGDTLSLLLMLSTLVNFCLSEKCDTWERVEILNSTFPSNESVYDRESLILYPSGTYWKEDYNGSIVTYGCPCKSDRPCLRKCCQMDQAMDNDTLNCIPYDEPSPWFRPNVTINDEGEFRTESEDYFGLIYGNFCFGYLLEPEIYPDEDKFYVNFTDGTLSIPQHNKTGLGPADYCLEYFPAIDSYLPYVCFRTLGSPNPPPDRCTEIRYIIYPFGMLISVFFLLISLSVYILLPSLRNLHGKCLMCHIVSLIVAYVSLAIVQGLGNHLNEHTCIFFGFLIYLSLLCSFFWLNIMCIDIYIAFSSFRPVESNTKGKDRKKFLLYLLYAWGLPIIIIMITAVMELQPDVPDSFLKPKFNETCWFNGDESRMVYFISPVGLIVLCNIVLFLVTARNIFKWEKEAEILIMPGSRRHDKKDDKKRFKLYVKLSIVMGVFWVMEIISWIAGGSKCIWLATDLVNALQGVFIFLIFVWKKKVRHQLMLMFRTENVLQRDLNIGEGGSSDLPSASTSLPNMSSVTV